jgi:hypothetical protein
MIASAVAIRDYLKGEKAGLEPASLEHSGAIRTPAGCCQYLDQFG